MCSRAVLARPSGSAAAGSSAASSSLAATAPSPVLRGGTLADLVLQLLDLPPLGRRTLSFLAGLFLRCGDGPVQNLKQPSGIEIEPARAELKCLPTHQLGQARWQLVGTGHPGPFNQNGDDTDITCQRRLDLQPHEVVGVIQAPPPVLVGDREPPIADQGQQHVAGSDRGGDHLDEVVAQFDGVDILEDLTSAEVAGKPVEQPTGRVRSLFAPVAHEDPAQNVTGGCTHDLGPRSSPTAVPLAVSPNQASPQGEMSYCSRERLKSARRQRPLICNSRIVTAGHTGGKRCPDFRGVRFPVFCQATVATGRS